MRTGDPGWKEFGSGIRDKHPGSATLLFSPCCTVFDNCQDGRISVAGISSSNVDYLAHAMHAVTK
jgi:hypothetical protein